MLNSALVCWGNKLNNRKNYLEAEHLTTRQLLHRRGNQALVREINLSTIMNYLHENAPISRSALAEITGLNKTTVSSLVQELINQRFIYEVGLDSVGTGRPAMLLGINPTAGCIISAEIGVDFIAAVCANFAAEVIWQHRQITQPETSQTEIIDCTLKLLRQAADAGQSLNTPLLGLAIGLPGLIDQETGTLLFGPNLKWKNVPVGVILRQKFNLPIFVDNEANMAALGEYYFGAAKDYQEILYVSAGVGLGGGIVRNGQLVGGATGFAGEFGHMTMVPNGNRCNCGNRGCWETQVSQSALFNYIRAAITSGRPSVLSGLAGGNLNQLTVPMVVKAAQIDDAVALEALTQIGQDLGVGIASLVNALNPDLVVFGGILSLAGEFLLPQINHQLQQRTLLWDKRATKVVLAKHGLNACTMGGIAMVYQAILAQPGSVTRQIASPELL